MKDGEIKVAALESIELALSRQTKLSHLQFSTKSATLWSFLRHSELLDYKHCGVRRGVSEDSQLFPVPAITQILQQRGIEGVYLGGRSNSELERWSRRTKIGLISLPYKQQAVLENKIHFDRLLKRSKISSPASLIVRTEKQLRHWNLFPAVLQVPDSHGGLGTFIVKSVAQAFSVVLRRRLKYPLLLREFVAGIPCGVSLVLSKRKLLVSALRAQCSLTDRGSENFYYGIQWIPRDLFTSAVLRKVNRCIEDLANLMRAQGVRGGVHFDLMISKVGATVIECNPRPSGACPQLALNPALLHRFDYPFEHTVSSLGEELSADRPTIPKTSFDGCTVDFDFLLPRLKPGQHKSSSRAAGWVTPRSAEGAPKLDRDFIYPYHPIESALTKSDTLGVYISQRPFFKVTTSKIDFRSGAESRLEALARNFI